MVSFIYQITDSQDPGQLQLSSKYLQPQGWTERMDVERDDKSFGVEFGRGTATFRDHLSIPIAEVIKQSFVLEIHLHFRGNAAREICPIGPGIDDALSDDAHQKYIFLLNISNHSHLGKMHCTECRNAFFSSAVKGFQK